MNETTLLEPKQMIWPNGDPKPQEIVDAETFIAEVGEIEIVDPENPSLPGLIAEAEQRARFVRDETRAHRAREADAEAEKLAGEGREADALDARRAAQYFRHWRDHGITSAASAIAIRPQTTARENRSASPRTRGSRRNTRAGPSSDDPDLSDAEPPPLVLPSYALGPG